jgi:hypothetical protein
MHIHYSRKISRAPKPRGSVLTPLRVRGGSGRQILGGSGVAPGQRFAKIFSKFGQDRNSTKNDRNLGDVNFSPIFAKITLFVPRKKRRSRVGGILLENSRGIGATSQPSRVDSVDRVLRPPPPSPRPTRNNVDRKLIDS